MPFVSPKMSLRVWNLLTDLYNHSQLADNWMRVDQHDHTPGRGVQIPTEGIADGAVTEAKIAPGSLALSDGAVTLSKLDPNTVGSRGKAIVATPETRTNT